MRKLLGALAIAVLLWSAWWIVASRAIASGVRGWLEARQAEGWQAELADIAVTGFPATFRARLTDLALADPETGLAWTAPSLTLTAPAWWPWRVEATFPAEQTVATPFEKIAVAADAMTASLALVPGFDAELDRAEVSARGLLLASSLGWSAGVADGILRAARQSDRPRAVNLLLRATGVRPSKAVTAALDPSGRLPREIEALELHATAGFDAPWDRHAIEDRRPQPTDIALDLLSARWGGMALEGTGTLAVDPEGVPDGRIALRATNWREMLRLARGAGLVPEGIAGTVERGLGLLAGLSGNPETLDAPLTFAGGRVAFGPIPLGPAPRLRLR